MGFTQLVVSRTLGPWLRLLQAALLLLFEVVLLTVDLIKCYMRQMDWIWSQPLSARLIRVAKRLEYSWKIHQKPRWCKNRGWILLEGNSPWVCNVYAHFVSGALLAFILDYLVKVICKGNRLGR